MKCHINTTTKSVTFISLLCQLLSSAQVFGTPLNIAYQTPLSMGFSRQEYWSVLRFPSPGDCPDPGIKLGSPALQVDSLLAEPLGKLFISLDGPNLLCRTFTWGRRNGIGGLGKPFHDDEGLTP